jgi:putative colanic acid biosynthesis acetyltransferase WcaF
MPYRNRPITVGDGAWVGAQVFVGPGVTVGMEAVVTAGSVVTHSLPPGKICSGNPCVAIKPRWKE